MILNLKNNHIYLPSNNVVTTNDTIRLYINPMDIVESDYLFVININGESFPFKHEYLLNKTQLSGVYLNIKIIATHKETGKELVYTADTLPITKAIVLGSPCSEWYPEIIRDLNDRVIKLENKTKSDSLDITHNTEQINKINSELKIVELAIKEINESGEVI